MNLQAFLFKMTMTLYYVLRLMILIAPLSIISVYSRQGGWKYGFTFIQNSLEVGIFIAFAMAFLLGFYHALSFEVVGQGPLENFLKSKQKVRVKGTIDMQSLQDRIAERWSLKSMDQKEGELVFRKRAIFMPADHVRVSLISDGEYEIESRPFVSWWFLDFARNFKTVTEIAKMIKRGK